MSWSVLQSASNAPNTSPASATYTSNLSSGSTLVAMGVVFGGSVNTTTMKDGAGNSFVRIAEIAATPGNNTIVNLWALNVPAGDVGTKPTITVTGGSAAALLIQEVS